MADHFVGGTGCSLETEVLDLASRIFDMARSGDAATLAAYLDAGVPVNLTNTNGDTLVMLAAYYGHDAAVAALIERGADVDRHNNRGQTPLAGAIFKNETTVMEQLLRADADPLVGSPSALETARYFGREELARRLQRHIQRGIQPDTQGPNDVVIIDLLHQLGLSRCYPLFRSAVASPFIVSKMPRCTNSSSSPER
jgi:ankyrin repeat protein